MQQAIRNTHYTGEQKQNMIDTLIDAVSDKMSLRVGCLKLTYLELEKEKHVEFCILGVSTRTWHPGKRTPQLLQSGQANVQGDAKWGQPKNGSTSLIN